MSATVWINMKAPKRENEYLQLDGQKEKTFDAMSHLYLSDTQDGNQSGCAKANDVPVSVTVRTVTLPETGGFGTTDFIVLGLLFCTAGAVIPLWMRRRRVRVK